MRAQGLGAHTPLPHAAHSLSPGCPSQRNRHPSPRLAAERARGSSEVGGVLSARRRSKTKGRARFMRAQGLGAHTPLPHAAHSLSPGCPSQRNRHPSLRLAAERAREKLGSRWCAFGAPAFENEGESSLHARPRPRRSHPATPRGPQPQPRVPQPKKPPPKPQARRRTRERKLGSRWCAFGAPAFENEGESSLHARPRPRRSHPATPRGPQPQPRVPQPKKPPPKPQARRRTREREARKSVVCFRRAGVDHKRKGRARFMRAQGLGAHTPLPHAAHSLSPGCPSQRNRHPSLRLAVERAREKLGSRWCAFGAPAFENEGESSLHARPRPRRSHPATPRGPQPQPRVPQPKKPPPKPQARRRTREREARKSVVCFRRAGVRKRRGELASCAPKASALTPRYPTRPTASAPGAPAKETAI